MNFRFSIKIKTTVYYLLIALTSILAVGLFFINTATIIFKKEISEDLLRLAESKGTYLFVYLDFIESKTADFASDSFIKENLKMVAVSSQVAENLNGYLIRHKQSLESEIKGILITNLDGKVVVSTDNNKIGKKVATQKYFTYGKNRVMSIESLQDREFGAGNDVMVSAAPLTDKETGEALGVIAIFFDIKKFYDIISGSYQLEKGAISGLTKEALDIYIVNKEKNIIGQSGKGMVDALPISKCFENNEEISGIYKNYAGKEVIGTSMCLPDKRWVLLVEKDATEAFAPISSMEFQLGIIMGLIAILVSFIALILSRILVRPIEKLTKAVSDISQGKLDVKIDSKLTESNDEIGDLARAFERVMVSLKLAMKEVEKSKPQEAKKEEKTIESETKKEDKLI